MFSVGVMTGGVLGGALAAREVPLALHTPTVALALLALLFVIARVLPQAEADTTGGQSVAALRIPTGGLLAPALIAFCCLLAEGAALDWSAVFLAEVLALETSVGSGVAVFGGAMAAARFAGHWIAARLGPRTILGGGGALAAVGFAGVALALPGLALAGVGVACMVPTVLRVAAAMTPQASGFGVAAVSTVGYARFLAGPALIGLVAEAASLRASFGVIASAMMVVAVAAVRLPSVGEGPSAPKAGAGDARGARSD